MFPSIKIFNYLFFILVISASINTFAVEESLDLETEPPKLPASINLDSSVSKFLILGRVDLTAEYTPNIKGNDTLGKGHPDEATLDNNHFLFFLKVKASEKTSFLGEFSDKNFFSVDYANSERLTTSFGKIIIPFGDTRFFHHFYGGIQGYSGKGVMLNNIWSSPGVNLDWAFKSGHLDTYLVRGPNQNNKEILLQEQANNNYFAFGTRWTTHLENKLNIIGSAYWADYYGRQSVFLAGVDLFTDYGAFEKALFKKLRISYGIANAMIEGFKENYAKRGDYIQIATNFYNPAEFRIRYGTYIDDSRLKSVNDVHNFNLGMTYPIDVIKILVEYQWNFEAVDEIDNDTARVMVSLDF